MALFVCYVHVAWLVAQLPDHPFCGLIGPTCRRENAVVENRPAIYPCPGSGTVQSPRQMVIISMSAFTPCLFALQLIFTEI